MTRQAGRLIRLVAVASLAAAACASHHTDSERSLAPAPVTVSPSPTDTAAPSALPTVAATRSAGGRGLVTRAAFGMHFLGYGAHTYPSGLAFGSARIWDMGVRWADLQPQSPRWDPAALARLDGIVGMFAARGVSPILVLGQTPPWAERSCPHGTFPATTCGPSASGSTSPWAAYVRFLVNRYDGRHGHPKVTYFETWDEPNIRYGWNDTVTEMAALQQTAYGIVHGHGAGQLLLSPSWATSLGTSAAPLSWLEDFLREPGGRSYDITDLHLYPTVPASRADYGPEWVIDRLPAIRAVLNQNGVGGRPLWNTETNIGAPFAGIAGAGQVARTYVLGTQSHVARTFWYAADGLSWGGVFLEKPDYTTLTAAGVAYGWLANRLTGAQPLGCSVAKTGAEAGRYSCRYHLSDGRSLLVLWATGASYPYHPPTGTRRWYDVTGVPHPASRATKLTVTPIPIYVVGSFHI